MWDAMLIYEVRRRELARTSEYAWLAREAHLGSRRDRSSLARRRVSALLLALGARLAGPPANGGGSRWVPLLEELCR